MESLRLLNLKEVAQRLQISVEQVRGLVGDGELSYINLGRGKKRPRMRFAEEDVDALIERRRRKITPCLSTSRKSLPTGSTTSRSHVVGFMAQRAARLAGPLKSLKPPNESANENL